MRSTVLPTHPLDEYRIILNHVCNMTMKDVDSREWEEFQNKELLLGGIVTGYREGLTKTGKPYGILKIEDMSGSGEMPLFGDNYINFSKYGKEGLYLYIKAVVQPRRWKEAELDFKINSIQLLQDVKDSLIHSISISIPIGDLNEEVISELSALMKSNPGKTQLFFQRHRKRSCGAEFFVARHQAERDARVAELYQRFGSFGFYDQ